MLRDKTFAQRQKNLHKSILKISSKIVSWLNGEVLGEESGILFVW